MSVPVPPQAPCTDPAVWCGIPVYNNAGTIVDVVRRSLEQISNIVVVDDGSTDADLTELLKPLNIAVVRHPKNVGKGAALLTAFRYAAERGAEFLITLDGDGQHFPEDIPRFLPRLAANALLIGYRDEVTGVMPCSSQFGREFSDFWIYLETGQHVRDTQSGFRAYPLTAITQLKLDSQHYNLEMEVITKALWAGIRTETVMIRVLYPPVEERVSSFRPVRDNFRISLLHARLVARQLLPIGHRRIPETSNEMVRNADPTKTIPKHPVGSAPRTVTLGNEQRIKLKPHTESEPTLSPPSTSALSLSKGGERGPDFPRVNVFSMNLALTAALSTFFGIVLWPYGVLIIAYLCFRLHLNKTVAVICLLLTLPSPIATLSKRIGHALLQTQSHPNLERFFGSHILALPAAIAAAWLAYMIAGRIQARNCNEHRRDHSPADRPSP